MHCTALDKDAHKDHKADAHQHHHVPVVRDPIGDREQRLLVEQQILQPHQRTLCVHRATPQEHIAVPLKVIAGRSRTQTDPTLGQVVQVVKLARTPTRVRVVPVLARQVAQLALVNVRDDVGREEALGHVPQQTNRPRALARNAQLSAVIALGLVIPRLWLGALCGSAIAAGTPRALCLLSALDVLVCLVERTAVMPTTRTLTRTALSALSSRAPLGRSIETQIVLIDLPWIAALVQALFVVKPTIALFPALHNLIPAERTLGRLEAVTLLIVLDCVQHV